MPTEEQIKESLMEYHEQKLPVLLCGDPSFDYVDLVIQTHKANDGIESSWEYFGSDKLLNTNEAMAEEVKRAIEVRDYVRMDEILRNCKSTPATMASFDWSEYDCNSLYNELLAKEGFMDLNHLLRHLDMEYLGTRGNMFLDFEPSDNGQYWQRALLERKGMLLIVNLFCETEEDKIIYRRLAPKIRVRKDNDHNSGDWLVMHTYDPGGFPDCFRNQFVEIALDGKKKGGSSVVDYEGNFKAVKEESTHISTPPNTKWNDIEMFFIDVVKETIDISISGKEPFTKGYWDLGLKHRQAKKAVRAWEVLKEFAKSEGNVIPTTKVKFEQIKSLRDALRTSFGIPEDPIPHYDKEGYKTLFRIEDKSFTKVYKKSISEKENIECSECGEVINKHNHNNIDDEGGYICDNCKRTSHDRLSNENEYSNYPDDE